MTRALPTDPARIAQIRADLGVDTDNLPLSLTPQEREAAQEPHMPAAAPPSFVPPNLRAVAAIIASIGAMAMLALPSLPLALPAWVGFAVFALTAIASFLAGLALPTGMSGKPIVPLTAVPVLAAIAAALGHFAAGMPEGTLKSGLLVAVALLLGLAGVVTPAPGQALPAK